MYKLMIFSLAAFLWSCQMEQPQAIVQHQPNACVFLHDVSLTFKNAIPPDRDLLLHIAREMAKDGGVVAFGIIGSPDATPQFIRQAFFCPPVLVSNPTYSDRIAYHDSLKIVQQKNDSLIDVFTHGSLVLLQEHIKGHAWTDINKGFDRARQFFSEMGMAGYGKILIVNSDGNQDVITASGKRERAIHPEWIPDDVTVISCGWSDTELPKHWYSVESPAGLLRDIQFITSK